MSASSDARLIFSAGLFKCHSKAIVPASIIAPNITSNFLLAVATIIALSNDARTFSCLRSASNDGMKAEQ